MSSNQQPPELGGSPKLVNDDYEMDSDEAFVLYREAYKEAFVAYEKAFIVYKETFVAYEKTFFTYEKAFVAFDNAFVVCKEQVDRFGMINRCKFISKPHNELMANTIS